VVEDIQKQLEFKKNHLIQKSFERKNVAYIIQQEEDQYGRLQKILQGVKGTGIVYVNSRKRTQVIAQYLQRKWLFCRLLSCRINTPRAQQKTRSNG